MPALKSKGKKVRGYADDIALIAETTVPKPKLETFNSPLICFFLFGT